jgi:hypothetical protein
MEPEERSWRTWSDLAQRSIIAFIVLDVLAYAYAALPGGMAWDAATVGGIWLVVDAVLIWKMLHGSRSAVGWSFAIAMLWPISFFLTHLPVWGFNEAHTTHPGFFVGFGLPQAIVLAVAMGSEDRQDSGVQSRAINRPHTLL